MPSGTASPSDVHAVRDGVCQLQTNFDDEVQVFKEIRAADVRENRKQAVGLYMKRLLAAIDWGQCVIY